MLRRGFVSLLILLIGMVGLAHAGETVSHEFYEGYCENGEPVVIRWDPRLDQHYRAVCIAGKFVIEQKEIISHVPPDKEPAKWPDRPADWSSWVGIWLNNMGMVNPYKDVVPYVTASTGRTLIPIRMVTEGMGGEAEWNEATQTVTIRLGKAISGALISICPGSSAQKDTVCHGKGGTTPLTADTVDVTAVPVSGLHRSDLPIWCPRVPSSHWVETRIATTCTRRSCLRLCAFCALCLWVAL